MEIWTFLFSKKKKTFVPHMFLLLHIKLIMKCLINGFLSRGVNWWVEKDNESINKILLSPTHSLWRNCWFSIQLFQTYFRPWLGIESFFFLFFSLSNAKSKLGGKSTALVQSTAELSPSHRIERRAKKEKFRKVSKLEEKLCCSRWFQSK